MSRRGWTLRWRGRTKLRLMVPSHRCRFGYGVGVSRVTVSLGWLIVTVWRRGCTEVRRWEVPR